MSGIKEILRNRPLLIDGAMGTLLQEGGLKPGACPEELNVSRPELVDGIHGRYIAAGADIITTNTFGGTRMKLREYGLEGRLVELNAAAVRAAKEAAAKAGRQVFVAGDVGPTGKFLQPVGELSFDEAFDAFSEQVRALADAGADIILIETMSDIREARAAVIAAKAVCGLPVAVTMTFQQDMRTLLGTPPEAAVAILEAAGADFIGANCSLGPEGLYEAAKRMAKAARVPLIFQPNAGLPKLVDGKTVFPATPEDMAAYAEKFLNLGVAMLGSCCGSTPAHTEAMGHIVKKALRKPAATGAKPTTLASGRRAVNLGTGCMPVIIGERINPTGRKELTAELTAGKMSIVKKDAKGQAEAGAGLIDINVGLPGGDEAALMPKVVRAVEESTDLPIVIDSTDPAAIEAALKETGGKALVNSVTGDKERLDSILPLVKKYGAAVVGLTVDEEGVPATAEKRVEIAKRILAACERHGIPKEDLVIDALVLTASAEQAQAVETLKAIGMLKEMGLATSLGISNISFGLPDRGLINQAYLLMALGYGLDAAMVNPYDQRMTDAMASGAVLTGRDKRAEEYITIFRKRAVKLETGKIKKALVEEIEAGDIFVVPINLSDVIEQHKLSTKTFYIKILPPEFNRQVLNIMSSGEWQNARLDSISYKMIAPEEHNYAGKIKETLIEKSIIEKQQKVEIGIRIPNEPEENRETIVKVEIDGETIPEKLRNFIISGNKDEINQLIELALNAGFDPISISNNYLIPALTEVGRLYEAKEFFLPQVMQSAETMKAAFTRLKEEMKGANAQENGTVVLATVFGDVHDIGKNILSTLLENHGLKVIDLGKNVTKEAILDEAQKNKADVIGLSALMTTTMTQMDAVIKERDRRGLKIPVIIGGAVVTESYAKSIGADGCSRDALEAVGLIKSLMKKCS